MLEYGDAFPDDSFQKVFSPYSYEFSWAPTIDEPAMGMTFLDTYRIRIYLHGHDTLESLLTTIEHESLHAAMSDEMGNTQLDIDHEHYGIQKALLADDVFGSEYFSIVGGKIISPRMKRDEYARLRRGITRRQKKIRECR